MLESGVRIVVEMGKRCPFLRRPACETVRFLFTLISMREKYRSLAVIYRQEFLRGSRRGIAFLLCFCMTAALFPVPVRAADPSGSEEAEAPYSAGQRTITGDIQGPVTISEDTVWGGGTIANAVTVASGASFVVEGNMRLAWNCTINVEENAALVFQNAAVQRDDGKYRLTLSGEGRLEIEGDCLWAFSIQQGLDMTVRPGAVLRLGAAVIVGQDMNIQGGGTIIRGDVSTQQLIRLPDSAGVTVRFSEITLDGGAVWKGGAAGPEGNTGRSASAPLLYVGGQCEAVLEDGAVLQNNCNTARDGATNGIGGGVYIAGGPSSGGRLVMEPGSCVRDNYTAAISGSEAAGGVTVGSGTGGSESLIMTGGEIRGNCGPVGGVSLQSGGCVVSGAPVVGDNRKTGDGQEDAPDNIYAADGLTVTVKGPLEAGAYLGASCRDVTETREVLFAEGASGETGYEITAEDASRFACDSAKCIAVLETETGKIFLRENLCSVVFKTMDGSAEYKRTVTYAGQKVELFVPDTPEGYSPFSRLTWTTEPMGGGERFDFSKPVNGSVILYALWEDADGTEENPYRITTQEQLVSMAEAINGADAQETYKDRWFVLETDAAYTQEQGIGAGAGAFEGCFDGNGHTITVDMTQKDSAAYTGLFARIGASGTVKDLTVEGSVKVTGTSGDGTFRAAGLAAYCEGVLENCTNLALVTVSFTGTGSIDAGGVAGFCSGGAVSGCANEGAVSAVGYEVCVGGVLGRVSATDVKACENRGAVAGEGSRSVRAGGAAGAFRGGETGGMFADCGNRGTVTGRMMKSGEDCFNYTGGVVGHGENMAVQRCTNAGTVQIKKTCRNSRLGGIAGAAASAEISGCTNEGAVETDISGSPWTVTLAAGGLAGEISGGIRNSSNSGSLDLRLKSIDTVYRRAVLEGGGLAGYADGSIFNSCNTGSLSGKIDILALPGEEEPGSIRLAGLVCRLNNVYDEKLENCYSTADFAMEGTGSGGAGVSSGAFGLVGSLEKKVSYCFWKTGGAGASLPFGPDGGGNKIDRGMNRSFAGPDGALSEEISFPEQDGAVYDSLLSILNAYAAGNAELGLSPWRTAPGENEGYPALGRAAVPQVTARTEDSVTIEIIAGHRYAITETAQKPGAEEWIVTSEKRYTFSGLSMDTPYYIWAQKIGAEEDTGSLKVFTARGIISLTITDSALDYDGLDHTLRAQVTTPESGASVTYLNPETDKYEAEPPRYSSAGEYTIHYRAQARGYEDKEGTARLTIRALPLSLSTPAAVCSEKEYDGTTQAAVSFAGALDAFGILDGDRGDVTLTAAAFYAGADVGEAKNVTVVYSLLGSAAENYKAPQRAAGYTSAIIPRTVTVTGAAVLERDYDQSRRVQVTGGALAGVVPGDEDTVGLSSAQAWGTIEDSDAGRGKAVTVTGYRLTGTGKENYRLEQPRGLTVTIRPRSLGSGGVYSSGVTVAAIGTQIYTGLPLSPAAVVTDGERRLKSEKDYTLDYKDNVDPGSARVLITGKGNYTGTITAAFLIGYGKPDPGSFSVDVSGKNERGWYRAPFEIRASQGCVLASDPKAGPWTAALSMDEETPAEGRTAAVYIREDRAGSAVAELPVFYRMDKSLPVLEDGGISGVPSGWTKESPDIILSPEDGISGVESVSVTLSSGGAVTAVTVTGPDPQGKYIFTADVNGIYEVTITDRAGNSASREITVSKIDRDKPSVFFQPEIAEDRWHGGMSVAVTAEDGAGSRPEEISLELSVNGAAVSNPAALLTSGVYALRAKARDAAGNEELAFRTVRVDTVIDDFARLVRDADGSFEQLYGVLTAYADYTEDQKQHIRNSDDGEKAWTDLSAAVNAVGPGLLAEIQKVLEAGGPAIGDIVRAEVLYEILPPEYKKQIDGAAMKRLAADRAAAQGAVDRVLSAATYEEQKAAAFSKWGYGGLTDGQKKLFGNEPGLTERLETMVGDVTAVDGVLGLLSRVEKPYRPASKAGIAETQNARQELSGYQAGLIPEFENRLIDALIVMKDRTEAAEALAEALPAPEDFQRSDERRLRAALEAYGDLTAEEKAMYAEDLAGKLDALYEVMLAGLTEDLEGSEDTKAAAAAVRIMLRVYDDPDRTVETIRQAEEAYEALEPAAKNAYDNTAVREGSGAAELLAELSADREAVLELTGLFGGFLSEGSEDHLRTLEPGDLPVLQAGLEQFEELSQVRRRLTDCSVSGAAGALSGLCAAAERTKTLIGNIPLHDEWDPSTGGPQFACCSGQVLDPHDFSRHRAALEAAAADFAGLPDRAGELLTQEEKERLRIEYGALMAFLNFSVRAETPTTVIELRGLSGGLDFSDAEGAAKMTLSVEARDEVCAVAPEAPAGKSLLLSVNIRILARLFDDAGADPTTEAPYRTLALQPLPGRRILVRMKVPAGCRKDSVEIWHVADSGALYRLRDFILVREEDCVYAVFETDGFSQFLLYGQVETQNSGSGHGHSSRPNLPADPVAEEIKAVFSDIGGHWAEENIRFAAQKGFLSGMSDGTFHPEEGASRAMTVTALWNMAGKPRPGGKDHFSDVKPGSWYEDAVNWAAEQGIVAGTGGGRFEAERPVTRQELAVIFYNFSRRAAGWDAGHGSGTRETVSAASWNGAAGETGAELILLEKSGHIAAVPSEKDRDQLETEQLLRRGEQSRFPLALLSARQKISAMFRWEWQNADRGSAGTRTIGTSREELGARERKQDVPTALSSPLSLPLTALSASAVDMASVYEDQDRIAVWARDAVSWCMENSIMTGRPGNRFAPEDPAVRAELATVVQKFSQWLDGAR